MMEPSSYGWADRAQDDGSWTGDVSVRHQDITWPYVERDEVCRRTVVDRSIRALRLLIAASLQQLSDELLSARSRALPISVMEA